MRTLERITEIQNMMRKVTELEDLRAIQDELLKLAFYSRETAVEDLVTAIQIMITDMIHGDQDLDQGRLIRLMDFMEFIIE